MGRMTWTVPPMPANSPPTKEALAFVGRVVGIESVDAETGSDLAGDDAVEGVRSGNAAEVEILEQQLGSVADGDERRAVERVGDPQALERMMERIAHAHGRSLAGLRVVLEVLA